MSARFETFMKRLRASKELAAFGFNELAGHPTPERYLDDLRRGGFFAPEENPIPIEDEKQKGFFQVPYWPALNYLLAVAKRAEALARPELGAQVLEVVRDVTMAAALDQRRRDNYHTNRLFAEILGSVPVILVTEELVELVPTWLDSRFGAALVSEAVSKGVLTRLVNVSEPQVRRLAVRVLQHLTELKKSPKGAEPDTDAYVPVVEPYWLRTLLLRHARSMGRLLGAETTDLLAQRLRVLFGSSVNRHFSSVTRPAIGDHEQNHSWETAANGFVEALRDATIEWVDTGDANAQNLVGNLLESDLSILRRIGVFVLKEKWAETGRRFVPSGLHFQLDMFHESFELLSKRFLEFSVDQQIAVRGAIEEAAKANSDGTSEYLYRTSKWLRALEGKGVDWAEAELARAKVAGVFRESTHPDFEIFHETRWGPGPSPIPRAALKAMAVEGSLLLELSEFQGKDATWNSPIDALLQELEEAIVESPDEFLGMAAGFRVARDEYFYTLLAATSRIWSKESEDLQGGELRDFWSQVVGGCRDRILSDEFWKAHDRITWKAEPEAIAGVAMRAISAGARDDTRGISAEELPVALEATLRLMGRLGPSGVLDKDPMHQAINSTRGKAIEALIDLALFSCRLSDERDGNHEGAWERLQPAFDDELERCVDSNFEFSTLLGSRLPNFVYVSHEWTRSRALSVFSIDHPDTRESALDGLSYAPSNRLTYRLLRDGGVVLEGLRQPPRSRHARERLVELVGLAYLWGDEELSDDRMHFLLRGCAEGDLVVLAQFFWSVERQGLDGAQKTRILELVRSLVDIRDTGPGSIPELKRSLGRLICYVDLLDESAMGWLERVIPEVARGVDLYEVAEGLKRLADSHPREVLALLTLATEAHEPDFDLDGHLLATVRKLAVSGLRAECLVLLERLRRISGSDALYIELRA